MVMIPEPEWLFEHGPWDIYAPPFEVDDMGMYVFDARGKTAADFTHGDAVDSVGQFRVRGWGRMGYLGRPAGETFDAVEDRMLRIISGDRGIGREVAVRLLNANWLPRDVVDERRRLAEAERARRQKDRPPPVWRMVVTEYAPQPKPTPESKRREKTNALARRRARNKRAKKARKKARRG